MVGIDCFEFKLICIINYLNLYNINVYFYLRKGIYVIYFIIISLYFDVCLVIVSKDKILFFDGELYMYKFIFRFYVIFKCERS